MTAFPDLALVDVSDVRLFDGGAVNKEEPRREVLRQDILPGPSKGCQMGLRMFKGCQLTIP